MSEEIASCTVTVLGTKNSSISLLYVAGGELDNDHYSL